MGVELRRDDAGWSYRLIPTWDGLYTPVAVRFPDGATPAPMVLLGWGNGGGGLAHVEGEVAARGMVAELLLARGYGAAWIRYRTEVDLGYARGGPIEQGERSGGPLLNRSPLDHEDVLAIVADLATDPGVDADRIAFLGGSHGGELVLKILAEAGHGLAAAVAAEPAAHEFLAVERGGEDVEHLDVDDVDRLLARCDLDVARQRAARVDTPVLIMGRERDPLHPVFLAAYRLLEQAGAPVRWTSHDHPEHGYVMPRGDAADGYVDRDGSERAMAEAIDFLDDVLRP